MVLSWVYWKCVVSEKNVVWNPGMIVLTQNVLGHCQLCRQRGVMIKGRLPLLPPPSVGVWCWGFPGGTRVKNPPAKQEVWVWSLPGCGGSPGEGNSNPLQNSWLGNPMSRGASRATVQRVRHYLAAKHHHIHSIAWFQAARVKCHPSYKALSSRNPNTAAAEQVLTNNEETWEQNLLFPCVERYNSWELTWSSSFM